MAFVITDPCIDTKDQACVSVCPVDCIHFDEGADRMLYINPAECIDCGACQPACPVSAIFPEGDVPEAQARFIEINSLWYDDPAAARAMVGGDAAPAPVAATPAASGQPESAPEAAPTPAETAAEKAPATEAAESPQPAGEPAPEPAIAAAVAPPPVMQVSASASARTPEVSQYRLPPAVPVASLVALVLAVSVMFIFPGPIWATITWAEDIFSAVGIDNGGGVGATVLVLAPLVPILLIIFLATQWNVFARFAASHPRSTSGWRYPVREWRRNEESRQYYLEEVVQNIARDRFSFPDAMNPDLKTYVNLPTPTMGLEIRGSGDKMFPDIVTLEHPGHRPVAIAQVESRETVTREQAAHVWAALENKDCPVYIYVPAGLLARAKDLAASVGVKNVKFRTWRWSPQGMVVQEA